MKSTGIFAFKTTFPAVFLLGQGSPSLSRIFLNSWPLPTSSLERNSAGPFYSQVPSHTNSHSFNSDELYSYFVPGTVLGAADTDGTWWKRREEETDKNPSLCGAYNLERELTNKENTSYVKCDDMLWKKKIKQKERERMFRIRGVGWVAI